MLQSLSRECIHCGEAIPRGEATDFCCRGCETVHGLLRAAAPAASRDREASSSYAYLDDPAFVSEYAREQGREMDLYLEGVHCAACVWATETLPVRDPSIESVRLDLSTGIARVKLAPDGRFAKAAASFRALGYPPHPVKNDRAERLRTREDRVHLIRLGVAAMAAGNIMLMAIALYAGADGRFAAIFRWASFALFLPVLLYSAVPFYRSAWAALRSGSVSIDVPIVLGILVGTGASVGALAVGSDEVYFDSISSLVLLLLATRYLLRKISHRALTSAQLMHFLAPSRARRLDPASRGFVDVAADSLKPGDRVRVLPGECVPVDGFVTEGESDVDRALLTGESMPVGVGPGAAVLAGTWNRRAPIELRVVASGAGTRLASILEAMDAGMRSKAPIVSHLDRVGRAFVWASLGLSIVGLILGYASGGWHEAISRALAVAIVVCPCTFALATPLAMSLALERAAKRGLLVKGAEMIERLSQVRTVFFDKTGTLTLGELGVLDWKSLEDGAAEALLALEARSAHPIARAVLRSARVFGVRGALPAVQGFSEKAGVGVSGRIAGALYEVRASVQGGDGTAAVGTIATRISVLREGRIVGELVVGDRPRNEAAEVVGGLRALGLETRILSGDSETPVQALAASVGVPRDACVWSASPEEKAARVSAEPRSLMVGDGANDAVALASAHAGMAVQGGMEASLRAAGVYSTRPGIGSIVTLLIVARETMRVIRRNLVFAILYNVVGVTVALAGGVTPLFAALLMPASALTVFLSTLAGTGRMRRAAA